MLPKLNILVFGAGAIGTYIGGSLVLRGHKVVFLERPSVSELLKQRGLRLLLGDREERISDFFVVSSLQDTNNQVPFDAAIFAVKSYDTQAALQPLRKGSSLPPILCLQNGVENEAVIGAELGPEKVIPGTVTSAIGRKGIGDVSLERLRGVGIGSGHTLSEELVQVFNDAGLNARLYPDAMAMKWSKLLTNLLANASSAILDMSPAQILGNPHLYRLEVEQLRETLEVMAAQNLKPIDLPGTPVRLLAFSIRHLTPGISRPLIQKGAGKGRGEKMPSFHIDLHSGKGKSEVEYLNGAVVRFGEKFGVDTPVNKMFNSILLSLTRGEIPIDTFSHNPERLLDVLQGMRDKRKLG